MAVPKRAAVVGRCPEVEVTIRGKKIPCLLDTGSQVTLFSHTLFQKYFGEEVLCDARDLPWLTLKAANGLKIPYVGYAVLDFIVGGLEIPARSVVIVQDACLNTEYGLLGMNVISECWEALFQKGHPGEVAFKSMVPPSAEKAWDKAFTLCRRVQVEIGRASCRERV